MNKALILLVFIVIGFIVGYHHFGWFRTKNETADDENDFNIAGSSMTPSDINQDFLKSIASYKKCYDDGFKVVGEMADWNCQRYNLHIGQDEKDVKTLCCMRYCPIAAPQSGGGTIYESQFYSADTNKCVCDNKRFTRMAGGHRYEGKTQSHYQYSGDQYPEYEMTGRDGHKFNCKEWLWQYASNVRQQG